MKNILTVKDIWDALDSGKTVCWSNESYEVHPVVTNGSEYAKISERGYQALRVSCVANYFGGLIAIPALSACFVMDKKPHFKPENPEKARKAYLRLVINNRV